MLAVSIPGVLALAAAAVGILVVLAPIFSAFGRRYGSMTPRGDRIVRDRPEFKRPPNEEGLI